MTNLGKIFILFFINLSLVYATFTASISPKVVTQGDEVMLTLSSNVSPDFPVLSDIAGVAIERQSRSSSTSYINGVRTGSYIKHFFFVASHDITLPSYTMIENGKKVSTKPLKLKVTKAVQNDNLYFKAFLSKKEVMVGEPFFVTLVYKQAKGLDIVDRRLLNPSGKHFWVEKTPIESASESATHTMNKLKFVFTAQKSGDLTIDPAHIKVGEMAYGNDAWGNLRRITRYKTLFADTLKIKVNPLPKGVENVGNFKFKVAVDKNKSNEKDAINLTVTVSGEGNIADIPVFNVPLDSVLVYDEKPKKEHAYKNGKYRGTFSQKFAIVSDHNYTIPALSFSYYSLSKRKKITLKSKPIRIEIKPTSTASIVKNVHVEKIQMTQDKAQAMPAATSRSWLELFIMLFIGIFLGFISKNISWSSKKSLKKEKTFKLKLSDEKSLLQAIMPFADGDEEVKALVEKLSENIYDNASHKHDKKHIQALTKRLGIKS